MDMSYLENKPIAILGAGGVGKPCAADVALAGREVRLWDDPDFAPRTLKYVEKTGLVLSGAQRNLMLFDRRGVAHMDMVTDDLAKAVKGAGIVVVTTVAVGHEKLFRNLIPLLEDGQVIYIIPDNYGSLLLRRLIREMNCTAKVIVGGWGTSPYGARVVTHGGIVTNEISIIDRVCVMRGAALPTTDTDALLESAKYFPPFDQVFFAENGDDFGIQRGDTTLDVSISNINPVIHVPGAILGAAVMQNYEFLGKKLQHYSLYADAFCPAIAEVQVDFWKESEAVAKAAGTEVAPVNTDYFFSKATIYGPEYMGKGYVIPFNEDYELKRQPYGDGPTSLNTRYITEDIPVGCHLVHLLGEKFGVPTPIQDTMILLAETMTRKQLVKDVGYSLEYLGIGHLDRAALNAYLRKGEYSEA